MYTIFIEIGSWKWDTIIIKIKICGISLASCVVGGEISRLERSALCHAIRKYKLGFPGGAVVENLPANAGDTGSSPGLGRSHMPRSN